MLGAVAMIGHGIDGGAGIATLQRIDHRQMFLHGGFDAFLHKGPHALKDRHADAVRLICGAQKRDERRGKEGFLI